MKKFAIVLAFCLCAAASAQTDNTYYARAFPGPDVGTKVNNALVSCNPALQCYIVIDPSLAAWPPGTLPSLGANKHLIDYRFTDPFGGGLPLDICSFPGATFGDKVIAANAACIAAGGGVLSSQCIEGTTNQTTGTLPIEIGSKTVSCTWELPTSGYLNITQDAYNLPTPAAPTLAQTAASSGLAPGNYYVRIAYRSGGGVSACSTETSIVVSATGYVSIPSPPSTSYGHSYNVYASSTSNAETWQLNCLIGATCYLGKSYPYALLQGFETYPTAPTGTPAIIVHGGNGGGFGGGQGSGIVSGASGYGYPLQTVSTTNVSNIIATEDPGSPTIKNIEFGTNSSANVGIVTDSLFLLQSSFNETQIDGIYGFCGGVSGYGAPMMKIIGTNDVTLGHVEFTAGTKNCSPIVKLDNRLVNGMNGDLLHTLTFSDLLLANPANNGIMFQIQGSTDGTASNVGGFASSIVMINPSFEANNGATGVTAIDLHNTRSFTAITPNFGASPNSGYTAIMLSENYPCMIQNIDIQDANLFTSGNTFVNDTITPNVIPAGSGYASTNLSYFLGSSPTDNCATPGTKYIYGTNIQTDLTSSYPYAQQAAGASSAANATLVLDGNMQGGSSGSLTGSATGTVATSWEGYSNSSTGVFLVDTSTYPFASPSQKLTIGSVANVLAILQSNVMNLTAGNNYSLVFWARNDGISGIPISVGVFNATSAVTYCPFHNFALTSSWTQYSFSCSSSASGSDARVFLSTPVAGGIAGSMWVDNVSFQHLVSAINPNFGAAVYEGLTGNGSVVCTGNGTYTSGNIIVADANGNCVSSNTPLISVAPPGPQIVNCLPAGGMVEFNCLGDSSQNAASSTYALSGANSIQPLLGVLTSAATTGSSAGWSSVTSYTGVYSAARQPLLNFGINFSSSTDYSSNARIQLGLLGSSCSVATMSAGDSPICSYAMIEYSTTRSDAVYKCVTDNGSGTPTVTSIGTTSPSTTFQPTMSISVGASAVGCTVGTTTVTNTTTLPASSVTFLNMFYNTTLANSATHLRMSKLQAYSQNGTY